MIEFQSAHPVRGATFFGFRILPAPLFQSTRPVWGATVRRGDRGDGHPISIHAPRAGCDLDTEKPLVHVDDFNPRTPCGVRPCAAACRRRRGPDFNPRTPCGVRRWIRLLLPGTTNFNPRAPCGARHRSGCMWSLPSYFNPRAPCGARRRQTRRRKTRQRISIHAPRVGRDWRRTRPGLGAKYFNPRAPCGARRYCTYILQQSQNEFQSTRPVWGATLIERYN